jgi:hypothetical protein
VGLDECLQQPEQELGLMALLNFGRSGGGLFEGLFPETGGGPGGYERLPPQLEAQLAQEAREAAAAQFRARNGQSRGTADMSLFTDPANPAMPMTQQIMPTMPFNGQQPMPQMPQQAPALGGPINVPSLKVAGVDDATLPLGATPTQGGPVPGVNFQQQPQPPQPSPFPAGGDRLMAGLGGLFNSPTLVGGIGNMISGFATGERSDPRGVAQRNQTQTAKAIYDGLIANGTAPQQAYGIAVAAAGNPEIAKAILPQALGPKEPPKTMEELFARQAYDAQRKGGQQSGTVAAQPGQPSAPANYQDWIASQEAAKARGKVQGEKQAALPGALQRSDTTIKQIDELLTHKGFDRIFGLVGAFPNIPGGDAAGAQARLKQVKGTAFLSAYEMLKGGGAITEVEGQKAQDAEARLDAAQSPAEARIALRDFQDAVREGRRKLQESAGVTKPTASPTWTTVSPGVRIRERQ